MINRPRRQFSRRSVIQSGLSGLAISLLPRQTKSQCTLVELYPGYPGFKGNVTGLDGVGDYVCLDDLVAQNPTFDLEAEDYSNRLAAAELWLIGGPETWTWENWMAVEAERGLPATCFSCVMFEGSGRRQPDFSAAASNDPRLLLGGAETTYAIERLEAEFGTINSRFEEFFVSDSRLRALFGMGSPGHWNAQQVLAGYEMWAEFVTTPGQYADPTGLWANLITQGGYAPTPPSAAVSDQVYMVWAGVQGLDSVTTYETSAALQEKFDRVVTDWFGEVRTGSAVPFAEYLRDLGAAKWL